MNTDEQIEGLLKKAPAPSAPFGLERRLIEQASRPKHESATSWLSIFRGRSWAPGFALGLVLAGLMTVVAFQRNTLSKLKAAEQEMAASVSSGVDTSKPMQQSLAEKELKELQKQSEELQKLRAKMAEIDKVLAEQPVLAQENASLRAELSRLAANNPLLSPEYQDAMAQARQKAERIKCVNNLKNVGLAARIWATDNGDKLPKDFLTMTNELSTPKILICPSDPARTQAIDTWEKFSASGTSYEMLAPEISETFPGAIYVRCPIHNNVCRADGSVMQLRPDQQLIQRDGYLEIGE
jgi:tetrahydromethanopterin S-methyltransferase subunit F